jgi:hypothetical protein
MKFTARNISWTVTEMAKVLTDEPAFILSTPVEDNPISGTHTILIERSEHRWVARDACDRGTRCHTIKHALEDYVAVSSLMNRDGTGHMVWMTTTGLPSLELLIKQITLWIEDRVAGCPV